MDIMRNEYIAIGQIGTELPMRIYSQCGTYIIKGNYKGYYKDNTHNWIKKLIDIGLMRQLFEKYTRFLNNKSLKTEVKIRFERGYKLIRSNYNKPVYVNVERYSINFAVWSQSGTKYDKGFGSTNNPDPICNLEHEMERLYKYAEEEQEQQKLAMGFYNVILDSEAAGLLAHEIVGHCMEADIWNTEEKIKNLFLFNKKISNEKVSIYDDPSYPFAFGSYEYDDEGVSARKVSLILDGVVHELMTSIDTATTKSNGHARAITYKAPPIVRMSNTYFAPGKSSVEKLFTEMGKGIYLCGAGESRGGINFSVKFPVCYVVEHGNTKKRVSGTVLLGNLKNVLENIVDVASDFRIYGGGEGGCGKFGQWPMPVSAGGPHIRINNMFLMGC